LIEANALHHQAKPPTANSVDVLVVVLVLVVSVVLVFVLVPVVHGLLVLTLVLATSVLKTSLPESFIMIAALTICHNLA